MPTTTHPAFGTVEYFVDLLHLARDLGRDVTERGLGLIKICAEESAGADPAADMVVIRNVVAAIEQVRREPADER